MASRQRQSASSAWLVGMVVAILLVLSLADLHTWMGSRQDTVSPTSQAEHDANTRQDAAQNGQAHSECPAHADTEATGPTVTGQTDFPKCANPLQ